MINSSAGILPLCLSSSFVQSTKHRVVFIGEKNEKGISYY